MSRITIQAPGQLAFADAAGQTVLMDFKSANVDPVYDPNNRRAGIVNLQEIMDSGEVIIEVHDARIILDRPLLRELVEYLDRMAQFGHGDPNGHW